MTKTAHALQLIADGHKTPYVAAMRASRTGPSTTCASDSITLATGASRKLRVRLSLGNPAPTRPASWPSTCRSLRSRRKWDSPNAPCASTSRQQESARWRRISRAVLWLAAALQLRRNSTAGGKTSLAGAASRS